MAGTAPPARYGTRTSYSRCCRSAATAASPSGTGSAPPAGWWPARRHGIAWPASSLAAVSGPGPPPTTIAGTSISTAGSEDGDRVHRAAGHALKADRRERELELPPPEPVARVGEVLELAVVDEPQAHGDDPDHVDRHDHALVTGRRRVLRDV